MKRSTTVLVHFVIFLILVTLLTLFCVFNKQTEHAILFKANKGGNSTTTTRAPPSGNSTTTTQAPPSGPTRDRVTENVLVLAKEVLAQFDEYGIDRVHELQSEFDSAVDAYIARHPETENCMRVNYAFKIDPELILETYNKLRTKIQEVEADPTLTFRTSGLWDIYNDARSSQKSKSPKNWRKLRSFQSHIETLNNDILNPDLALLNMLRGWSNFPSYHAFHCSWR